MPVCLQHLSHDILINIPEVGTELVGKQFLIYDVFSELFIPECKCDEESGITKIHLESIGRPMECQSHIRIVGMICEIHHHRILHVIDGFAYTVIFATISDQCRLIT